MTAEEYFNEAQRIFRNGQKSQAVELYRKAAYKNHSKAQVRLAQCYLNGYGVDINNRVALVWLQKAANSEDSEAEFLLGRCYLKGIGVAADKEQAIEWFKRAYIHGDPDAWGMLKTFGVDVKNITSDERGNRLYRSHAVRFPDFDEQYILDLLNVRATYVKGRDYYAEGRVTQLSWNDNCTVFTSRVSGTYDYSCTLNFNNNRLVSHECNCPAHYNYSGPCKHIVATMFAIMNQRHNALLNKKSTVKGHSESVGKNSTSGKQTSSAKRPASSKQDVPQSEKLIENLPDIQVKDIAFDRVENINNNLSSSKEQKKKKQSRPVVNAKSSVNTDEVYSNQDRQISGNTIQDSQIKEVFEQLIRYFPEGQEARIRSNICAFGEACLGAGDFESAVKYADMLLSQDCSETQRISAYRTKLFAKLKCRNINEVYHCKDFKRDMPEYEELILASSSNNDKLKLFAELPKKVEETLAEEERKRRAAEEAQKRREEEEIARKLAEDKERERQRKLAEEQRQRAEKEAERQRIAAERKAEQRRIAAEEEKKRREAEESRRCAALSAAIRRQNIDTICMIAAAVAGTALFIAAVVAWIALNATMPYKFPLLCLLFLFSFILFAAAIVLGIFKRHRDEIISSLRSQMLD